MRATLLLLAILFFSVSTYSQEGGTCSNARGLFFTTGKLKLNPYTWYYFDPPADGVIKVSSCDVPNNFMPVYVYDFCSKNEPGGEIGPFQIIRCSSNNQTQYYKVNAGNRVFILINPGFTISDKEDPPVLEFTYCQDGNLCREAVPIVCGEKYTFPTIGLDNSSDDYPWCGQMPGPLDGQDKFFQVTYTGPGVADLEISLESNRISSTMGIIPFLTCLSAYADEDSNIFSCQSTIAGKSPLRTVIQDVAGGQTIYFAIDYDALSPSDYLAYRTFTVEVTCVRQPCRDRRILGCGKPYSGSTGSNKNRLESSDYRACYAQQTKKYLGPDQAFRLNKPSTQSEVYIDLFTEGVNLDLLVLDNCTDAVGRCLAISNAGQPGNPGRESILLDASFAAGDYYIVVDGPEAANKGKYTLAATCGELECSTAKALVCGERLTGETTTEAENNVSFYRKGGTTFAGQTGRERIYTFTLDQPSEVSVELSGFGENQDLNLFLLEGCDRKACVAAGANGPGLAERVTITLSAGTYFLVVDGYNSSAGTYNLLVDWGCTVTPSLCDIGASFIDLGNTITGNLTTANLDPAGVRRIPCAQDAFGGPLPDSIYTEYFVYYQEDTGDININLVGDMGDTNPDSIRTFVFRCACDEITPGDCESVCLAEGLQDNGGWSLSNQPPGFYLVVVVSLRAAAYGFDMTPLGPCTSENVERLECGTLITYTLGPSDGKDYRVNGEEQFENAYAGCYTGDRSYAGFDKVYQLILETNTILSLSLTSDEPMGLFLYDYLCGRTCIAFAENGEADGRAVISGRELPAGIYYLIVDQEREDGGATFELNVSCENNLNISIYEIALDVGDDCPRLGEDTARHELLFRQLQASEILNQRIKTNDQIHLFFRDLNGDTIQTPDLVGVWNGEGISVYTYEDDPNDPRKCGFDLGEKFIFKLYQPASGNVTRVVADFLPPRDTITARDTFERKGISLINKLRLDPAVENAKEPTTTLQVTPPFRELTPEDKNFILKISSNTAWNIRKEPQNASWLNLNNVTEGQYYKAIKIGISANNTGMIRTARIIVSTKDNSGFRFVVPVTQAPNCIPPTADAGPARTLTCAEPVAQLQGSSSSGDGDNLTYQWTAPPGGSFVEGENTATPRVNAPGTYQLKVSDPATGCFTTAEVTVSSDKEAPEADAGAPATLTCLVSEVELDGSGSTGESLRYEWKKPAGGAIASGQDAAVVVVTTPGVYRLLVTEMRNGCVDSAEVRVFEDRMAPVADAKADGRLTCVAHEIRLSASASQGDNLLFQWEGLTGQPVLDAQTAMPRVNTPGAYRLTVTETRNGCTDTDQVDVLADRTPPVADAGDPARLTCLEERVRLNGRGSQGENIGYAWRAIAGGVIVGGAATADPLVSAPGFYILTATEQRNGCTAVDTVEVTADRAAPTADAGDPATLTCEVERLRLDGRGSQGDDLLYQWEALSGQGLVTGANTAQPLINTSGTYRLTVTEARNGCTDTDEVTVTLDRAPPIADAGPPVVLTCDQKEARLDGSGSQGDDLLYQWEALSGSGIASGETTPRPLIREPGAYQLTVTELRNGCTASDLVEVSSDRVAPTADAGSSPLLTCDVTEVRLDGRNSQGDNLLYQWEALSGKGLAGEATTARPRVDAPGVYRLTVIELRNGCADTDEVEVRSDRTPPIANAGPTVRLTCNAERVRLDGSGSQGDDLLYRWEALSGNGLLTGINSPQPLVNQPGAYRLTVTEVRNGCTHSDVVDVIDDRIIPIADAGPAKLINCHTPSVQLNGNGSSSGADIIYQWTAGAGGNIVSGANTRTPVVNTGGTYALEVLNLRNGCSASASVIVQQRQPVSGQLVAIGHVKCHGSSGGSATVAASGGLPGYTFAWSTGGNQAAETGLPAGAFHVTITDQEGCLSVVNILIDEPELLEITLSSTAETARDAADGTASVAGTGGAGAYKFLWNTGATTSSLEGLRPGTYNVTVTDANGCMSSGSVVVGTPECAITLTFSAQDATCANAADGQASVISREEAPPVTYIWSNGAKTADITGLAPGTYSVTVTDTKNCPAIGSITIGVNDTIKPVITISDLKVFLDANGQASITPEYVDGGRSSDNCGIRSKTLNRTQFTCADLGIQTITLTVTDINRNAASATARISVLDTLAPQIRCPENVRATICTVDYALPQVLDNCSSVVPELLSGHLSGDVFPAGRTAVSYIAADASGNRSTCSFEVEVISDLSVEVPDIDPACFGETTGRATAVAQGGSQPYSFSWSSGARSAEAGNLPAGAYEVSVTDGSGCLAVRQIVVEATAAITVAADTIKGASSGASDGFILVSVTGGQPPFAYRWTSGEETVSTNEDVLNLPAGNYFLEITDAAGCQDRFGPFEVSVSTSINDPELLSRIHVFPNPTNGVLRCAFDLPAPENVDVVVMDNLGRIIRRDRWVATPRSVFEIDLSPFPGGMFWLKMVVGEKSVVRKVLVFD